MWEGFAPERLGERLGADRERGLAQSEEHPLLTEGVGVVNQFRGGLVFKAHRRVYHSTLGLRVTKKKKK